MTTTRTANAYNPAAEAERAATRDNATLPAANRGHLIAAIERAPAATWNWLRADGTVVTSPASRSHAARTLRDGGVLEITLAGVVQVSTAAGWFEVDIDVFSANQSAGRLWEKATERRANPTPAAKGEDAPPTCCSCGDVLGRVAAVEPGRTAAEDLRELAAWKGLPAAWRRRLSRVAFWHARSIEDIIAAVKQEGRQLAGITEEDVAEVLYAAEVTWNWRESGCRQSAPTDAAAALHAMRSRGGRVRVQVIRVYEPDGSGYYEAQVAGEAS